MNTPLRPVGYRVDPFDLRLFTVVLEHGTITAAAAAQGLSLAAASARIKGLEDLVGTPLLERSKAGVRPTDAGRAMARRAHAVLSELESLHVEMGRFRGGLRGTLRLLCNTAAMAEALPPRLGRFLARHADLDVETQELPSEAVLDALHRGAGELGIVASHVDTTGLLVQPWVDDRLVALLPRGRLPGTTARGLRFAALLAEPFVGLPAGSGLSRFLDQQARSAGRWLHHRARVSTLDAVAQLVAAGAGVAVMPMSAAMRWRAERVRILPLQEPWARRRLLLCMHADAARQAAVQALAASLQEPLR